MEHTAMNVMEDTAREPAERILVVDDDHESVRLLRAYLERAGYQVLSAGDGETALSILRHDHPDLAVLDLMLPHRDGWSVIKVAREEFALAQTPIIILTGRGEDSDRILGLELRADDYVTKPYNPREVVLRVRSILRRSRGQRKPRLHHVLQVGRLLMDVDRHEVLAGQHPVDLTLTEFRLLRTLMEWPDHVFTRSELIEQGLGYTYGGSDRTLDSHIKNLRKKIEPNPGQPTYIETMYGVGYRIIEPPRNDVGRT